jgi:biopolymer transport protein ExbD
MAFARRRRRHEGVLELTPLIDVIFLLLIFFMVSTSFVVNREITIKLPESTSAASESNDQQLIMLIDAAGGFLVAGNLYRDTSVEALAEVLRGQLGGQTADRVSIRLDVDQATDYRFVIKAMDVCRAAGISDVRLNTRGKN